MLKCDSLDNEVNIDQWIYYLDIKLFLYQLIFQAPKQINKQINENMQNLEKFFMVKHRQPSETTIACQKYFIVWNFEYFVVGKIWQIFRNRI